MTCKIPYIDDVNIKNATTIPANKITELRDTHIGIVGQLKQATFINNGVTEPLFHFRKGYLLMDTITGSPRFQAQVAFLEQINTFINSAFIVGTPLYQATTLPLYYIDNVVDDNNGIGIRMNVLAINVFNTDVLTSNEKLNYMTNATIDIEDADMRTLVDLLPQEIEAMMKLSNDWSVEDGQHTEFFIKHAERFGQALSIYLGSINKSSVGLPNDSIKLNKLYELNEALNTAEGATAASAVHNFVFESMKHIANIIPMLSIEDSQINKDNVYFLLNELQNPLLPKSAREANLRAIAKIVNDSAQYLHLFNYMKDFQKELKRLGFKPNDVNMIDTTNPKFIAAMSSAVKDHLTEGDYRQVLEFFSDPKFTTTGLRDMIRGMVSANSPNASYSNIANVVSRVSTVIEGYSKKRDIDSLLSEAMERVNDLQSDIKHLHEEILVQAIFPTIEKKQSNRPDEFKLTQEAFRNQIGTAEHDEGFVKAWLDAAVKSNDALTANAANIVAEAYYKAHIRNVQDAVSLSTYVDNLDIDKMTKLERDNYYDGMTHTVIEHLIDDDRNMIEADQEWLDSAQPTITVSVLGKTKIFKGTTGKRGFMTVQNTAKYAATKKAFDEEKKKVIEDLYNGIFSIGADNSLNFDWTYLERQINANWDNPDGTPNWYYREIYNRFYKGYQIHVQRKDFERDHIKIKSALSNALYTQFEKENYEPLTQANLRTLYTQYGVENITTRLATIPAGMSGLASSHLLRHQQNDPENETYRQWLLMNIDGMMHRFENGRAFIYMYKNHRYQWVDVTDVGSLRPNVTGERLEYFSLNRQVKVLNKDKYNIERGGWGADSQAKWGRLHSDQTKSNYYKTLFNTYSEANKSVKGGALKHGIVPQIEYKQQFDGMKTGAGLWGRFTTWLRSIRQSSRNVFYHNNIAGSTQNPNLDVETRVGQYINGEPVRDVPFEYTVPLDESKIETDLFRSVLAYKTSSNNYQENSKIEPVMQILRRTIAGDMVLGLKSRNVLARDSSGNKLVGAYKRAITKNTPNLNEKLVAFIDDSVYGEGKKTDNKILHKLANVSGGYLSLVNLAWNLNAMFTNLTVGHINNIIQASSGEFSTKRDNLEAAALYTKYMFDGDLLKDLTQHNPALKSKIGQLNVLFDSIQGEYSDNIGDITRRGSVEKFKNRATMWTQGGAEHQIQTQLMIQLMKGYWIPNGGGSLWDNIVEQPNRFISFTPYVTPDILEDFRTRLHAVNKNLHGQYAKLDKSMVSRYWWGKMFMMYKKYIYSSYRNRFGAEQYDWELGDSTQGYANLYFSNVLASFKDENNPFYLKSIGMFLKQGVLKANIGALDSLTGRLASKNIRSVNDYLFGGLSDKEVIATKKYTTEVAWFVMLGVFAMVMQALNDDDDEEEQSKILQGLEAISTRAQGDIGMFIPFYNSLGLKNSNGTLVSFDKSFQMLKNPFAQMRSADNLIKLGGQVLEDGGSIVTGGGFETYERKGIGYEKGDYKITRAVKKVFPYVSAYHHVLQFLNPAEQLQYDKMLRQHSSTKKKKDEKD